MSLNEGICAWPNSGPVVYCSDGLDDFVVRHRLDSDGGIFRMDGTGWEDLTSGYIGVLLRRYENAYSLSLEKVLICWV